MKQKFSPQRRSFMKRLALFGSGAALFSLGRPAAAQRVEPRPQPEAKSQGYRLTEHIKNYYRTAGL